MAATEISRWVKRQRAKKRQTQQQVADAIGMSRTWVSSLEAGTFRPKVEECLRLAAWAKVEPSEVLTTAGYPLSVLAAMRTGDIAESDSTGRVTLSRDELQAMLDRAAAQAVRELMAELEAGRNG